MNKLSRRKKIGAPPGSLTYVGYRENKETRISLINYNVDEFNEIEDVSIEDCFNKDGNDLVSWINVNGISEVALIDQISSHYNIHPLVREDVLNTHHRPKFEDYESYFFIVLKMLYYTDKMILKSEHISLILFKNMVISFQEIEGDVFELLRERIRNGKGKIRSSGADYLLYAIMDSVIDNYFLVLEGLGEKIEVLESEVYDDPNESIPRRIQVIKKEGVKVRRSVFPLREVVSRIEKTNDALIDSKTRNYFRDLYDHTIHVVETVETYRDTISSLMEMYLSSLSFKMNKVMQVLTIIATIFIPLTFIAGIYGMNFEYMPELKYKYGYFVAWGVMLSIFIAMMFYFKKQKWF